MRSSLAALLGFYFTSICFAQQPGDKVVTRSTTSLLNNGKNTDAVGPGQILQVLKTSENHLWVSRGNPGWISKASVLPLNQAETYFNKSFQTGAGASDYLARGNVRVALGKLEEGIADLRRAVELAGTDKLPYLEALGFGLLAAHDPEPATKAFSDALKQKNSASALMGRGLAYYQMGHNDQAAKDYQDAIALKPDHAFPRKYLGVLLHDQGKLADAHQQLAAALKLDSFDAFARKSLGRVLFDLRQYQEAIQQFDLALAIDKQDVEAIVGRGVVLHAVGTDLKAAQVAFQSAIALVKPGAEHGYIWSNLGQVETELDLPDAALANLNRSIELDPSFLEARSHRAYLVARKFAENTQLVSQAKEDMRLVFLTTSETRTFWDFRALAEVHRVLGKTAEAESAKKNAIALLHTAPQRFASELK